MSILSHVWPYLVFVAVVVLLTVLVRLGRTRHPLPIVVPTDLADEAGRREMVVIAEIVRSGAFYVCGAVLDWSTCCEFAAKLVRNPKLDIPEDQQSD